MKACRLFGANRYLNQCWNIVNKGQTSVKFWSKYKLFIHGNASENIVCEMVAVLSREKWVKGSYREFIRLRDVPLFLYVLHLRFQWCIIVEIKTAGYIACRDMALLMAYFTNPLHGYIPDSKSHGANMGPTGVLSAPDGPHVGPMKLAFRDGSAEGFDMKTSSRCIGIPITNTTPSIDRLTFIIEIHHILVTQQIHIEIKPLEW